jgi:hypothetical protein
LLLLNVLWDILLLKSQTKQKSFLQSSKGDNTPRVDIDGRLYTAQELSAMTLQKKKTEDYLGQTVTEQLLLYLLTLMMHNVKLRKKLVKLLVLK